MATLRQVLLKAGWAPISVLLFHAFIARTSLRQPLDFLMHFLGGAAIAFFVLVATRSSKYFVGEPSTFGRYLLSFSLACTVGLFWEFGEFASDSLIDSHIQQSLHETMCDLIADS